MRKPVLASLFLLLAALPLHAQSDPVQKALEELSQAQGPGCERPPAYQVIERWPDGSPSTLTAVLPADTNCGGELAILRRDRNGALHALASNADDDFFTLELRDLTGDGVPEIIAGIRAGRNSPSEIFHWDGHKLDDIGNWLGAVSVDLDHDGAQELIEEECCEVNECGSMTAHAGIQRFRDGAFSNDGNDHVLDVIVLTKYQSGPETPERGLNLPKAVSRHCHFHLVNGVRGGKQRLTGIRMVAHGEANGSPAGRTKRIPIRLTAADEYADVTVDLPSRCNRFDVTLEGPKGSTVAIVVESVAGQ